MDDLGKRLVAALLEEKDPAKQADGRVRGNDIVADALTALRWAEGFFDTHGKWPTPKQVQENTGILLPPPAEDLEYVCDLVRKRKLGKHLAGDLKNVMQQLDARDPDEAMKLVQQIAASDLVQSSGAQLRSFRETGQLRHAEYQELQRLGGLRGIPTPWNALDYYMQGWVDGSLHVIIAMQNTGKTWACCLFADDAFNRGFKILFITMEMSATRIERRLDAMHYKIPFGDLRDAQVDMFREIRWVGELHANLTGPGDILIADKQIVQYVVDVEALVQKYEPDLIVIDGGYRFRSKGGRDDWLDSKQIVAELQTAAERTKKPWIVSTQQGEVASKARLDAKERAYKVKYAKEWVINPDIVIEMYQNEDLRLMRHMEWSLLKERDSKGERSMDKLTTNWNLHQMDFEHVITADDIPTGSTGVTY